VCISRLSHACYSFPQSHRPWFNNVDKIRWKVQVIPLT
jgi:hypothetical protein